MNPRVSKENPMPIQKLLLIGLLLYLLPGTIAATPPNVRVNSDNTSYLQNEQQIWISPKDANTVIAHWRDWRLGYRRTGIGVSTDGGATWQDSLFTDFPLPKHSDPCLVGDLDGNFYACALNFSDDPPESSLVVVWKSTDDGVSWSDPVPACPWVPGNFEDKQMTALDRTGGAFSGNYYITWTRFENPTRIMSVRSTDGCATFDDTVTVAGPLLIGGQEWDAGQFSMPTVDADGTVHVFWLGSADIGEEWPVYAIRHAWSTDGGQSFQPDGGHVLLDHTIGYFYTDGNIDIYAAPISDCDISGGPYNNNLYYSQTQVADWETAELDVIVWRSTDHGLSWSEKVVVNDDPPGQMIDQFHPWLIVNEDGVVMLIFYDQRNDPTNHYLFDAYFSCSFDGAETFIHNMRISDVSVNPDNLNMPKSGNPVHPESPTLIPMRNFKPRAGKIAEYNGIHAKHDTVITIWTDTRNGHQDSYSAGFVIPFMQPRLYLPENDSLVQTFTPSFCWSTCWHENEDSYRLELSTSPGFPSLSFVYEDITDNNFTVPSAVDSVEYFWRVKAFRASGDSTDYSETFSFQYGFPEPPYICGDADSSDDVDIDDIVFVIAYIFSGGPTPEPPESADVNCAGGVDIDDAVYLIAYVFSGGPPPCDPDDNGIPDC